MIQFTLKSAIAIGAARVKENGDTVQNCLIETEIQGIAIQGKTLTDIVELTVPNSVFEGAQMPTVAGWLYIKETLAPQWVSDNYKAE